MTITHNTPNDDCAEMVAILRQLDPDELALVRGFALGLKASRDNNDA